MSLISKESAVSFALLTGRLPFDEEGNFLPLPALEETMSRQTAWLDGIKDNVPVAPVQPKGPKKERPTIELEGEDAELFDSYAAAETVLNIAGANQKVPKKKLLAMLAEHFVRLAVKSGKRPDNPQVTTATSIASFQVKHVNQPTAAISPATGEPMTVQEQFKEQGFSPKIIKFICDRVLNHAAAIRTRSLDELVGPAARPEEQAVGKKISKYIHKYLTKEEQALLLEHTQETYIDECWKEVAVAVACEVGGDDFEACCDALERLWRVLPVQPAIANLEFSGDVGKEVSKLLGCCQAPCSAGTGSGTAEVKLPAPSKT